MHYNNSHCKDPTVGQAEANIRREERRKMNAQENKVINRLLQYQSYKLSLKDAQEALLHTLAEKEDYLSSIRSLDLEGMPGASSGASDPTYCKVQRSMQLYDKRIIRQQLVVQGLESWIAEVDAALLTLPATERYILQERYSKPKRPTPFYVIAQKTDYSEVHCKRLKKRAIMRLCECFKR